MKPSKSQCERIKRLVEEVSKIEDIGIRTRKRPIPEMKQLYCWLCRKYSLASLELISRVLGNYDHATALHNSRTYQDRIDTRQLDFPEILETCNKILFQERKDEIQETEFESGALTLSEVRAEYRIRLIKIIEKRQSIMRKLQNRIMQLEDTNAELREAFRMKK